MENNSILSKLSEWILNKIIYIILKSLEKNENLPIFSINIMYQSLEERNPQIFYLNIINRSKNDYIIDKAFIIKRNHKTKNLITFFPAEIFLVKKKILMKNLNYKNIDNQFKSALPIDSFKIGSKSSSQIFIILSLDENTHNYWKNFETKIIPGFISTDGKIYPSWQAPKFEWNAILKDEMNFYWLEGNKRVPFQILMEKYRLNEYLKSKLNRGEEISIRDIFNKNVRIFTYNIKYLKNLFLVKYKIRESL